VRRSLSFALTASVALSLAVAAAVPASAGTLSTDVGSCPSHQTVMTSNSSSAVNGYLCAQEEHSGNQSIGPDKTHSWGDSDMNVAYYPQYTCYDVSSSSVSVIYGAIFGSATYTATNWLAASATTDNTRHWSAALLWTLGAGTVTGFSNGCDVSDQTWNHPPAVLNIDSLSVTGLPDDNTFTAGTSYTFTATVTPASATTAVGLLIDGKGAAQGAVVNGVATIKWTPPAEGTHTLSFGYAGNGSNTGAQTNAANITISGGVSTFLNSIAPIPGSATNSATANVTVTPSTTVGNVLISDIDALDSSGNPTTVGKGTLSNGTASVTITPVAPSGTTHRYLASVINSSKVSIGQSTPLSYTTTTFTSVSITGVPSSAYQYSTYTTITGTFTAGAPPSNGMLNLYDNGALCCSVIVPDGQTSASFNWTPATSGNHTLDVKYKGDTGYAASTSSSQSVTAGAGIPLTVSSAVNNGSGKGTATVTVGSGYAGTVYLYSAANTLASANGALMSSGKPSGGKVSLTFTFPTSGSGTVNLAAYITPGTPPYEWSQNVYAFKYGTSSSGAMTSPLSAAGMDKGVSIDERMGFGLKQAGLAPEAKKPVPGHPGQGPAVAPAGAGVPTGASMVNDSLMVPKSGSRSIASTCPAGSVLLHADSLTSGPLDAIDISMSETGATFVAPKEDAGYQMRTQLTCRRADAHLLATAGYALGTPRADVIALTAAGGTAFAGPGNDRAVAKGKQSVLWGGLGDDSMLVSGADSIAVGGEGRDKIVANGKIRARLDGGIGRDLLIGSYGPSVILATDGVGGDRVICRSASTRVVADHGDRITGPCTNITYAKS